MGQVVVDTNVVLFYLTGKAIALPPSRDIVISVITEIELLSYSDLKSAEEEAIRGFCGKVRRVQLDETIKERTILVRRTHRLKLPDAIIAATALSMNASLYSFDRGFQKIPELIVNEPTLPE